MLITICQFQCPHLYVCMHVYVFVSLFMYKNKCKFLIFPPSFLPSLLSFSLPTQLFLTTAAAAAAGDTVILPGGALCWRQEGEDKFTGPAPEARR